MSIGSLVASTMAATTFLSCGPMNSTDRSSTQTPPPGVPRAASVVPFQPIEGARSAFSLIPDRRRLVICDETEWRSFWDELHGHITPPPDPSPSISLKATQTSEELETATATGEEEMAQSAGP